MSDQDKIRAELVASGHDGLYCTEERCACGLDNLVYCEMDIEGDEGIRGVCLPAYRHDCIGEECASPCDGAYTPGGDCYGPSKDGPKRKEPDPVGEPGAARREWEAVAETYSEFRGHLELAVAALAEAEARIAELEAALEHKCDDCLPRYGAYQERAEKAEAARDAMMDEMYQRLNEAEVELAAPRARSCPNCSHRGVVVGISEYVCLLDDNCDHDFYCSYWRAKVTP